MCLKANEDDGPFHLFCARCDTVYFCSLDCLTKSQADSAHYRITCASASPTQYSMYFASFVTPTHISLNLSLALHPLHLMYSHLSRHLRNCKGKDSCHGGVHHQARVVGLGRKGPGNGQASRHNTGYCQRQLRPRVLLPPDIHITRRQGQYTVGYPQASRLAICESCPVLPSYLCAIEFVGQAAKDGMAKDKVLCHPIRLEDWSGG